MKINDRKNNVVSNFDGRDMEFKLSTNRVLFEILKKNIYSDPIGSVVREIAANARDAMRRAGKPDEPISISLNNSYLVISDTGCGMSVEKMKDVYLTFGESDKRGDNSEQGAWGIGAKSPFAICDSYSLETHWDGTKYTYLFYIDEEHKDKCKLVSECQSDGCGTTVKIPIGDKYNEFKKAIYKYTIFYSTTPNYLGMLDIRAPQPVLSGSCWREYKDTRMLEGVNVLCDDIPYKYYDSSLKVPYGCVLICNIGDLELSASRENIIVTNKNTKHLHNLIEIYKKERVEEIKRSIKGAPDATSVVTLLIQYERFSHEYQLFEWGERQFTYPFKEEIMYFSSDKHRKHTPRKTHTLNNNPNKKVEFLTGPETLTWKQKRQINVLYDQNKDVYFVPNDFIFTPTDSIDNVKIPKKIPTTTGRQPKYIRGRTKYRSYGSNFAFNTHLLYTTSNVDAIVGNLDLPIIQVEEKTIPRIKKHTKWQSLEEYLDGFDKEKMIKLGGLLSNRVLIEWWNFISNHVRGECKKIFEEYKNYHEIKTYEKTGLTAVFMYLNSANWNFQEILFNDYPILSLISPSYVNEEKKQLCIDYVNMINERNTNV